MNGLANRDVVQYKVPLIGDTNVGKTSIVSRYSVDIISDSTPPTVGVSTASFDLKVDNQHVGLTVWDTAGQEKFRSLVPLYTRHAALLILVFDISLQSSFAGLESWVQKLRIEMGVICPIFVCGNKTDLSSAVSKESVIDWANDHNCTAFFSSAKTGDGIDELFQAAADRVLATNRPVDLVPHGNPGEGQEQKGCC
jgi:small GTP-binding protein